MTLTLGYLVILAYTPSWPLLHWASLLTSTSGVLFLLVARGHYSIDVILAYFVTTRVWWVYHVMANNQILKETEKYNTLANLWWWTAFRSFS